MKRKHKRLEAANKIWLARMEEEKATKEELLTFDSAERGLQDVEEERQATNNLFEDAFNGL